MVEKDSNLPCFNSGRRPDHYWRSVFEIKTVSENSKYIKLASLVKVFLAFQNSNIAVQWCISSNKNCVTSEKVKNLPDTVVPLRRTKAYGSMLEPIPLT